MFIRAKTRELKNGKTSKYFYMCESQRIGDKVQQRNYYLTSFRVTSDPEKLRDFWAKMTEEVKPYLNQEYQPTPAHFIYEIGKKFNIPVAMGDTHFLEDDEAYKDYLTVYEFEEYGIT